MQPTLYIYMGLQASGKSSQASVHVAAQPGTVVVSKDQIRLDTPPAGGEWSLEYERQVVMPKEATLIMQALKGGHDVIVDSTNLAHESRLRHLARTAGARAEVRFFNTDIDTCILRDRLRLPPKQVGEKVIRATARTYADQILYHTLVPYNNVPTIMPKKSIVLADIDGTLALPTRPWHDHASYMTDLVNSPIRQLLYDHWVKGHTAVFVTARSEEYRADTAAWLRSVADVHYDMLLMRPRGDDRRDTEVKLALFDEHVRGRFRIMFVLDDRTRVVRMWRALGLCCLQVADGDY